MRFMQSESVLQTKNRSGPAKNRFSVALFSYVSFNNFILVLFCTETGSNIVAVVCLSN